MKGKNNNNYKKQTSSMELKADVLRQDLSVAA